jgi:putative ABC transport system permease protein
MDDVVIVPVATAMKMLNRSGLFRLVIQVRSYADLQRTKQAVIRLLRERHGEEDVTVITQDAVVSAFSSILGALTMALGGIAAVARRGQRRDHERDAGLGLERTREVGLLKTRRRARPRSWRRSGGAILISSAGGLLGLALGWAAVLVLVAVYPALPACLRSGRCSSRSRSRSGRLRLLPARRATRLDPVAALAGR